MSPDDDALPPITAPFAEKLRAAMGRSTNYKTQRALGKALSTDGSLVGKWLNGTIPSLRHRQELERLLSVPGYFSEAPRADRLEALAAALAETMAELVLLQARVKTLEAQRAPGRAAPRQSRRQ